MSSGIVAIAVALALLPCSLAGLAMGLATLLLGLALTESCAIYGFVTALIIAFTLA